MKGETRLRLREGVANAFEGMINFACKIALAIRSYEAECKTARPIYQITITLEDRASQALGRVVVKGPAGWVSVAEAKGLGLKPEEVEARVIASELGEAALAALAEMSRLYPQVEILA